MHIIQMVYGCASKMLGWWGGWPPKYIFLFVSNRLKNVVSKNKMKISITFRDSVFLFNFAQKVEFPYFAPKISRISKKVHKQNSFKIKFYIT